MKFLIPFLITCTLAISLTGCTQCETTTVTTCSFDLKETTADSIAYTGEAPTFELQKGLKNANALEDTTFTLTLNPVRTHIFNSEIPSVTCDAMPVDERTPSSISYQITQQDGAIITLYHRTTVGTSSTFDINYNHNTSDSQLVMGHLTDSGTFTRITVSQSKDQNGVHSISVVDSFRGSTFTFDYSYTYTLTSQVDEFCGDGFLSMH